jgi:hypothetical protein
MDKYYGSMESGNNLIIELLSFAAEWFCSEQLIISKEFVSLF